MNESRRRPRQSQLLAAIGIPETDELVPEAANVRTDSEGHLVSVTGFVRAQHTSVRQRDRRGPRLLSTRRRTHGTRKRAGVRAVRRSTARAGPSDSEPHSAEGDGDPPRDLLADVMHYPVARRAAGETASIAAACRVLRHENGTRFVRTGWFRAHVRTEESISSTELANRMSRVGWLRRGETGRVKATRPDLPGELVWTFYSVPEGWESGLEDQGQVNE